MVECHKFCILSKSRYPEVGVQCSGKVSVCDYPPAKYIKSGLLKLVFSPYMDTVLYFKLILHEILQSGLSNDMYFIGKLP